jgi:hypothetical protein
VINFDKKERTKLIVKGWLTNYQIFEKIYKDLEEVVKRLVQHRNLEIKS